MAQSNQNYHIASGIRYLSGQHGGEYAAKRVNYRDHDDILSVGLGHSRIDRCDLLYYHQHYLITCIERDFTSLEIREN